MNQEKTFFDDTAQKDCIRRAQTGDSAAVEQLVAKNIRLVYSLVQRFCGRGIEREDLIQIGTIGLLKAMRNFDLSCENKFSTYAVPMILGELKRALRDDQPVHVSRSYKEMGYRIQRERESFRNQHQREPTLKELAESLGVSSASIAIALEANQRPCSLQAPLDHQTEQKRELQDFLKSSDGEDTWTDSMVLAESFKCLDSRLRYIMVARYFQEQTQQQIAEKLHISQVQVSRLEKQALQKMRNYLKAE